MTQRRPGATRRTELSEHLCARTLRTHCAGSLEAACFDGLLLRRHAGPARHLQGQLRTPTLHYGGADLLSRPGDASCRLHGARSTRHLGLGATLSDARFHHPYHPGTPGLALARTCCRPAGEEPGLERRHLHDRPFEARNFGMKGPAGQGPALRPAATRSVEACCALCGTVWEEGAMIMDKEEGLFIDPGKRAATPTTKASM